ncbi:MAG TPA: Ada metal-binding domain-containing protein [Drouetiella sp.]
MRVRCRLAIGLVFMVPVMFTLLPCFAAGMDVVLKEESAEQSLQQPIHESVLDPNLPVKYWGNLFSMKFHRPSCPFAKAMSPHNVVFFNFRRQAIESGQVPCRYCLPPNWTTVRAEILNPDALKSTTHGF